MNDNTINFDSSNLSLMRKLMKECGNSHFPFWGENKEKESMLISIFPQKIVTIAFQNNGWVRQNIYYPDGSSEESYEK